MDIKELAVLRRGLLSIRVSRKSGFERVTRRMIGDLLVVNAGTVWRWETGRTTPTEDKLEAYEAILLEIQAEMRAEFLRRRTAKEEAREARRMAKRERAKEYMREYRQRDDRDRPVPLTSEERKDRAAERDRNR